MEKNYRPFYFVNNPEAFNIFAQMFEKLKSVLTSETITQTTGTATDKVMSQKAVTDNINALKGIFGYSTDEIEIGKWIDGKQLYQKTWKLTDDDFEDGSYTLPDNIRPVNYSIMYDAIDTSVATPDEYDGELIPPHYASSNLYFYSDILFGYDEVTSDYYVSLELNTKNFSGGYYYLTVQYYKKTS